MHYLPHSFNNISPPGWKLRYTVTSYTTPLSDNHADYCVVCFDNY